MNTRRVTRSQKQTNNQSENQNTTFSATSRSLNENDLKRIKNFLKAYIIYRKRQQSPTQHEIDPSNMFHSLRKLYISALKAKGDTSSVPIHGTHEQKWFQLANDLIQSGVTSWRIIDNGLKKAFTMIEFTTTNPIEDLLSEGHVRNQVFKHLQVKDFQEYYGTEKIIQLTNEQRLDFLLQANDSTSRIHKDFKFWVKRGYFEFLRFVFDPEKFSASTSSGTKVTIDINTYDEKEGTYLFDLIESSPHNFHNLSSQTFIEAKKFAKFLIEERGADAHLTKTFKDEVHMNAIGYAIFRCGQSVTDNENDRIWYIIQLLLKTTPLSDFYVDSISKKYRKFGNYGVIPLHGKKDHIFINNKYICEKLKPEQIAWLIEHGGMDPKNVDDQHSDIQYLMHSMLNVYRKEYKTIQKTYLENEQLAEKTKTEIKKLEKTLAKIETQSRSIRKEMETMDNTINSIQQKKQIIDDVLRKLNIQLGGKKTSSKRLT